MNPGKLKFKIGIKRSQLDVNENVEWVRICDTWAWFKPVRMSVAMEQGGLASVLDHEVIIRYRNDVHPGHRLVFDNVIYEIRGCNTTDKAYLYLTCREVDRFVC